MAEGDIKALQRVVINIQYNAARIGIWVALTIAIVNQRFVQLWVGSELYGGLLLSICVSLMLVRDSIVRAIGGVIYAHGEMRGLGWLSLIESVFTIAFVTLGTRMWGGGGAALGALMSTLMFVSPFVIIRVAKIVQISPSELLWYGTGRALLKIVVPGFMLWGTSMLIPTSWGWLWVLGVCCVSAFLNVIAFDLAVLRRTKGVPWGERVRALFEAR
jgi:O-antigen/teichoic acid export membrane protein